MQRENVFNLIGHERERQQALQRSGRFPWTCATPTVRNDSKLAVLTEEVGEVAREVNEENIGLKPLDLEKLRSELIQTAACCVAWLESLPG
jgi:NTP pyrophosphatase (non-canonical NTP hydrolase)